MATGEMEIQEYGLIKPPQERTKLAGNIEFLCPRHPQVTLSKKSHRKFPGTKIPHLIYWEKPAVA